MYVYGASKPLEIMIDLQTANFYDIHDWKPQIPVTV